MTVNLNLDPHLEGFKPQPTFNVTAIFYTLDDVLRAIRSLKEHGFTDEAVSVYLGKDGLSKLDLHGKAHGLLARSPAGWSPFQLKPKRTRTQKLRSKRGGFLLQLKSTEARTRRQR